MEHFGKLLQQIRKDRRMTQRELAAASEVPLRTLQDYEQGQCEPTFGVVARLASALGKTPNDFLPADAAGPKKRKRGNK